MHLSRVALPLLVAGLLAGAEGAPPAPAQATLAIGVGALARPEYPGSDRTEIVPIPLLDARRGPLVAETRTFYAPFAGFGWRSPEGEVQLLAGAVFLPGRDRDLDDRLATAADIDDSAGLAAAAAWTPGNHVLLLRARASQDILGADQGMTAVGELLLRAPPLPWLQIQAGGGVEWRDGRGTDTWFGTAESDPGSGAARAFAILESRIPLGDRWAVIAGGAAGSLVGDAADSPVTARAGYASALVGVTWRW